VTGFSQSQYSVGVLYLVILNLPRDIRFKPENIIIAGIIPGPHEPKPNEINSYLRPLVKELNHLWTDGFQLTKGSQTNTIYAALIATVNDIPAMQKLCGFVGHMANHCCWKCTKTFPYNKELNRIDFSGADIGTLRSYEEHKVGAKKSLTAKSKAERTTIELQSGSRFTELMHLPYFDSIRFVIIDPMHNLFLGTAKRILHNQWLRESLISNSDLDKVQERICSCIVPINVGRMPRKISSHFYSLTADEWKNWTLLYSMLVLQDILPAEHLACWKLFVSACRIYCSYVITLVDIDKASELMSEFFRTAERLYGPTFLTFNTHLHLHLPQCFKDYGPCYGFWLFSFERYNGILGKYHTNQLSIEMQLMRKFINNMSVRSLASEVDSVPHDHHHLFTDLLGSVTAIGDTSSRTIFHNDILQYSDIHQLMTLSTSEVTPPLIYINDYLVKFMPPFIVHKFDCDSIAYLKASYSAFLANVLNEIPQLCKRYKSAYWFSERLTICKHLCQTEKFIVYKHTGQEKMVRLSPIVILYVLEK